MLEPTEFRLTPGIWNRELLRCAIQRAEQRDGSVLWKVRDGLGCVLKKNGVWVDEPQPSSRTPHFIKTTRWKTPEAAAAALIAAGQQW